MKLSGLNFAVKNVSKLTKKEKESVIDVYHKFFIRTYGYDVVDAFTCISKTNIKEVVNEEHQVKALAKNYQRAKDILIQLEENPNNELLLIYLNQNNLLGSAFFKRLDADCASVPFIALDIVDKDIWEQIVSFIENYFKNKGYKKMYVEIPLKDGSLLWKARDLGFEEDPKDIITDEVVYTYILNKTLEG